MTETKLAQVVDLAVEDLEMTPGAPDESFDPLIRQDPRVKARGSVTIYDVADQAGVSIKTVSRVMNGEHVRPETRDRVAAAATAMGYHPKLSARSLAGSRSFLIAVFVDAELTIEHWKSEHGSDYLARVQLGATLRSREGGYRVIIELIDHDPPRLVQEVNKAIATLNPDGVILTPPSADNPTVLAMLRESGTPFVRMGAERSEGGGLRLRLHDRAAAQHSTEHLISLGHRQIGFLMGDPRHAASRARLEGYREAMTAAGLAVDPSWIRPGDFTFQSGQAEAANLFALDSRPTAIFACNDEMAFGCLEAAAAAGLAVPRDLSVVGFDDSSGSRLSNPPLTTVRQPLSDLAGHAADLLMSGAVAPDCDEEAGPGPFPAFRLICRKSTAPPLRLGQPMDAAP